MGQIESVQVGFNPYGGAGAATQVNLFNYNGCEELTLGQLVSAICVRVGVALETESVNKTNVLSWTTRRLRALAETLDGVVNGTLNYDSVLASEGYEGMTVRDFLTGEMEYTIAEAGKPSDAALPASLDNVTDRMTFYERVKGKIDSDTSTSQKDMIDLQTYISRRDVAYSTATSSVRTLGATLQGTAANF